MLSFCLSLKIVVSSTYIHNIAVEVYIKRKIKNTTLILTYFFRKFIIFQMKKGRR